VRWILALLALTTDLSPASASRAHSKIVEPFILNNDGVEIAGEVHALNHKRCTAVIAVGGSSFRTRTDSAIADSLFLDRQTAVVMMDRRGNGLSTGSFEVPDTKNTAWQIPRFGQDVAAVARYLKRRGFRRVAIVGTSMGGWVNDSAAAAARDAIDAVVSINGGGSTVGVSDNFDDLTASGMTIEEASGRARSYRGPQGYDPRRDLVRMRQPVLWVFAAKDLSNPSMLDLSTVKRLASRGKHFGWMLLANTDHALPDVTTHEFNSSWLERARKFIRGATSCS
jgi:pimeloyl-ACP methyl ester carboxylesterase